MTEFVEFLRCLCLDSGWGAESDMRQAVLWWRELTAPDAAKGEK